MYPVVFTPEAEAQLTELHRYIAEAGSPSIAARFTDAIVTYCEGLAQFPLRGTSRDEIRPGLRFDPKYVLVDGRAPRAANETLVTAAALDRLSVRVGDGATPLDPKRAVIVIRSFSRRQ